MSGWFKGFLIAVGGAFLAPVATDLYGLAKQAFSDEARVQTIFALLTSYSFQTTFSFAVAMIALVTLYRRRGGRFLTSEGGWHWLYLVALSSILSETVSAVLFWTLGRWPEVLSSYERAPLQLLTPMIWGTVMSFRSVRQAMAELTPAE